MIFLTHVKNNYGAQLRPFLNRGMAKELFNIEILKTYHIIGEPRLMFNQWYLVIWGKRLLQVSPLQGTHLMVIIMFMVSGCKMLKERMLSLALELLIQLMNQAKQSKQNIAKPYKQNGQIFIRSLLKLKTLLKSITKICKMLNLLLNLEIYGCYKQERGKELVKQQ